MSSPLRLSSFLALLRALKLAMPLEYTNFFKSCSKIPTTTAVKLLKALCSFSENAFLWPNLQQPPSSERAQIPPVCPEGLECWAFPGKT